LTTHSSERSHDNHLQKFSGFLYLGADMRPTQEGITGAKIRCNAKQECHKIHAGNSFLCCYNVKVSDYTLVAN
jgi:hypothetical protein